MERDDPLGQTRLEKPQKEKRRKIKLNLLKLI